MRLYVQLLTHLLNDTQASFLLSSNGFTCFNNGAPQVGMFACLVQLSSCAPYKYLELQMDNKLNWSAKEDLENQHYLQSQSS